MHVLTILCKDGWMSSNLSEGWRRLGCTVEEFFYGTHMGKAWDDEGLRQNHDINVRLLNTASRLKAEDRLDLIFAVIYDDVLSVETVRKLRALDVPMVNYHVDMVGQWYRILRIGKYFDRLACAQKDNWSGLRRAGIHPYYMPMAANPQSENIQSAQTDFTFEGALYLGSPWIYRRLILSDLIKQGFSVRIYGHNWLRKTADSSNTQYWRKNLHDLRHYLLPRVRQEERTELKETLLRRLGQSPVPQNLTADIPAECVKGSYQNEDFVALVNGAAINLGFTHFLGSPGTKAERRQVRLREFEIPMAGGFYLTQDCAQLRELFQADQNIAMWNDAQELKEKIHYYLEHSAERRQIAQDAQAYCLQHHTWAKRFSELLRELKLSQPDEQGNTSYQAVSGL